MRRIIVDWLKTKQNYCYYQAGIDDLPIFQNRLADLLSSGRVHFSDLRACDCYIIENNTDHISLHLQHTTHAKHTFENFNIKCNEYVYDKVKVKEASKNFTEEDSIRNRNIFIDLLNELKQSHRSNNKFVEQLDGYSYKDIFAQYDKNSIEQFLKDADSSLKRNEFSIDDLKEYIGRIQDLSRGLKEIGIFYPFKMDHDIFTKGHYLFEINHLKFRKKDNDFVNLVTNFYQKYGFNSHLYQEVFTLEQFFAYPGNEYVPHFAYFDPYKNYKKYQKSYKEIKLTMLNDDNSFKEFIFELFELLNQAQIGIVKFQHENLIDAIHTTRSESTQYSVRQLVDILMKRLEANYDLLYMPREYAMLHFIKSLPAGILIGKNVKIKDLQETKNWSEEYKQNTQFILDELLNVLNKDSSSRLEYIVDHYKSKVFKLTKKYHLNEYKSDLYNMLLDLAYFYTDMNQEKLVRPYNSTLKKIYSKNQHRTIEDIVDFDFQEKFIQIYRERFERYQP